MRLHDDELELVGVAEQVLGDLGRHIDLEPDQLAAIVDIRERRRGAIVATINLSRFKTTSSSDSSADAGTVRKTSARPNNKRQIIAHLFVAIARRGPASSVPELCRRLGDEVDQAAW